MKKRLLALVIILVMILSFGLVACGSGEAGEKGAQGDPGAAGVGITSTVVTYQVGTSGTVAPTGTWETTVQATTAAGQFLWTRTVITYSNSTTSTSYSVSAHGATGGTGSTGSAGQDGTSPIVVGDSWASANYGTAAVEIFEFNWAHQSCIGFSRVTTTAAGAIDVVEFDEIFELSAWARIDAASAAALEGVTVEVLGTTANASLVSVVKSSGASPVYWPKYIRVGSTFYRAQLIKAATGVPNQSDTADAAGTNVRYFPLTTSSAAALSTLTAGAQSIDRLIAGRDNSTVGLDGGLGTWTPDNVLGKQLYTLATGTVANFDLTTGFNTAGIRAYKGTTAGNVSSGGVNGTDFYYVTKGEPSANTLKTTFNRPSIFKLASNYDWPNGNTDPTKGKTVTYQMLADFVKTYGSNIKTDSFKSMLLGTPVMSTTPKATWTVAVEDETSGAYFRINTGATASDVPNYLMTIARACSKLDGLTFAARVNEGHGHVAVPVSVEWNPTTDKVTIHNPLDTVGGTINGNFWTTGSSYNTTLDSIFSKLNSLDLTSAEILAWNIPYFATGTAWINTALDTTGIATGGTESASNFMASVLLAVQRAVEGKVTYATELEEITATASHIKFEEAAGADATAGYDYVLTVENKNYNSGSNVDAYLEFIYDAGLPTAALKPTITATFQTDPATTAAKTLTGVTVSNTGRLRIATGTDLSAEASVLCWKITVGTETIYIKIVFGSIA